MSSGRSARSTWRTCRTSGSRHPAFQASVVFPTAIQVTAPPAFVGECDGRITRTNGGIPIAWTGTPQWVHARLTSASGVVDYAQIVCRYPGNMGSATIFAEIIQTLLAAYDSATYPFASAEVGAVDDVPLIAGGQSVDLYPEHLG